jgi:two-component system, CitB family, sensor histidine kinase CitS
MKRFLQVPLQVKILGLVISLLLLVIGLLTLLFAYMETNEDVEQAEELALQTAKTLSYMPVIQDSFRENKPSENLAPIAEQLRDQVDASSILIENREGLAFGYVGQGSGEDDPKDRYRALVFGSYYVTREGNGEEEVLKGIAPIIIRYDLFQKVEGTVIVEFKMKTIRENMAKDIRTMLILSCFVLFLGVFGSIILAHSIRKDTFGLEPYQIAALYRERNAVFQSVKEGIVAINEHGIITMMNQSAKELLGITTRVRGLKVEDVIPSKGMLQVLYSTKIQSNLELQYNEKTMIINSQPIIEEGKMVGTVTSFRDRTEIKKMVDALSEVKQYSEDLRAQTHEFKNKLYVLLGLIQLGKLREAIELIQEETELQEHHSHIFFNSILDEKVQAILLGKLAKASEKKIQFEIEEESSLTPLPARVGLSPLIVILGNLIDNAFEAATESNGRTVSFFVTDIGKDIIFEVADNGTGIHVDNEGQVFDKGFSSKGDDRGYGLANVKEEVDLLGGSIEWTSRKEGGTIFTVFLPKNSLIERENK